MTALTAARAGLGAIYLTAPGLVPGTMAGTRLDERARRVVRILGARHVIQAALAAAAPGPLGLRIGSGVDALHAGSMLMLAATDRRRRRTALADATLASAFAAAGWRTAKSVTGSGTRSA